MEVGHFYILLIYSTYLNSQVPNSLGASPFTFYYLPNTMRACACANVCTYVQHA